MGLFGLGKSKRKATTGYKRGGNVVGQGLKQSYPKTGVQTKPSQKFTGNRPVGAQPAAPGANFGPLGYAGWRQQQYAGSANFGPGGYSARYFQPPAPTFETAEDLLGGPTEEESGRLSDIENALNAAQMDNFGDRESELRQDLASQLSALGTKRSRAEADVAAAIQKQKEKLPGAKRDIASGMAARGAAYSSANETAQTAADKAVADYETAQTLELDRIKADIATQMSQTQQSADRALADLREAREIEKLRQEAEGIKSAVSARRQAIDDSRQEADMFLTRRVNELVRSGTMDEAKAQAYAITEARQRWPNVPQTYIAGRLAPAKGPKVDPIAKQYGVIISPTKRIPTERATQLRTDARYTKQRNKLTGAVRDYLTQSGGDVSVQGYMNFLSKEMLQDKDQKWVGSFIKNNHDLISIVLKDAGFR